MIRVIFTLLSICNAALTLTACRSEAARGVCRLHEPSALVQLPAEYYEGLDITRPDGELRTLLYATGQVSADNTKHEVLTVFSESGEIKPLWIPYGSRSTGYTRFASEYPSHPLIETGRLRFEYVGPKSQVVLPLSDIDGRFRFDKRPRFTGTRRLMYGARPLLEQELTNWMDMVSVGKFVQIEPDGDRIVLTCSDESGAWLAVFNRSQLDREQHFGEKK